MPDYSIQYTAYAHSTFTCNALYTYLRISVSKKMMQLLNKAFFAHKKHNYESFLCCGELIGTYSLGSTYTWWQKTMNRQTHTQGITTVTHTLHVHQEVIILR